MGRRTENACLLVALGGVALLANHVLAPQPARAYTIETVVTRGCHEEITAEAYRAVRARLPETTLALPSRGEDDAFIDDAPFSVPDDLDDIGAVTLLLGARDNDVKSIAATDLNRLATQTANPEGQHEHCLRRDDQDEPTGSREALDDCRAHVRETLLSALEGLGDDGRPDGNVRERLKVTLAVRGQIEVSVPMFHLRAGRALHTLQDSFTHTFRNTDDDHEVTVVLNWIEYAEDTLNERVDGPEHLTELDRCDDPDALRTKRRELATRASTAALRALLDPALDREAKAVAIDAVLDRYLAFDDAARCTADNDWCDAPELEYLPPTCGCTIAGRSTPAAPRALGWLLLAITGVRLQRRLRGRARGARPTKARRASGAWLAAWWLCVAWASPWTTPSIARAEETRAHASSADASAHRNQVPPGALSGRVSFGASYDKPALVTGLGLRYQYDEDLMFGFDSEWNPWFTIAPTRMRAGAINSYVSLIRRFQLQNAPFNVRTSASLGVSVLLSDLVGAPSGSVGPYLGLSFLGVEWKVGRDFYLTVDPTCIAFPMPHVTGAPFGYLQYRFLVGLELGI